MSVDFQSSWSYV